MRKLLLVLLCGLVACRGTNAPPPAFEGRYELVTVGGRDLPTTWQDMGVSRGAYVLGAENRFLDILSYTWQGETITDTLSGSYVVRGDSVAFFYPDFATVSGYNGQELAVRWGPELAVYRR